MINTEDFLGTLITSGINWNLKNPDAAPVHGHTDDGMYSFNVLEGFPTEVVLYRFPFAVTNLDHSERVGRVKGHDGGDLAEKLLDLLRSDSNYPLTTDEDWEPTLPEDKADEYSVVEVYHVRARDGDVPRGTAFEEHPESWSERRRLYEHTHTLIIGTSYSDNPKSVAYNLTQNGLDDRTRDDDVWVHTVTNRRTRSTSVGDVILTPEGPFEVGRVGFRSIATRNPEGSMEGQDPFAINWALVEEETPTDASDDEWYNDGPKPGYRPASK